MSDTDDDDSKELSAAAFTWAKATYPDEYVQVAAAGFIAGASRVIDECARQAAEAEAKALRMGEKVVRLMSVCRHAGYMIMGRQDEVSAEDAQKTKNVLAKIVEIADEYEQQKDAPH